MAQSGPDHVVMLRNECCPVTAVDWQSHCISVKAAPRPRQGRGRAPHQVAAKWAGVGSPGSRRTRVSSACVDHAEVIVLAIPGSAATCTAKCREGRTATKLLAAPPSPAFCQSDAALHPAPSRPCRRPAGDKFRVSVSDVHPPV